jgi:hypothetical protein
MVGYLSKFRFAELRILTDEPDFSDIDGVLSMIGASPSMETQARPFLRMHLNLWVSLSQ